MHLNERRPGQRLEVLQSHLAQPNLNFTLPKVPLCGLHQRRGRIFNTLHLRPPLHRQTPLSSGAGPWTVLKQRECPSLGHGSCVQRYLVMTSQVPHTRGLGNLTRGTSFTRETLILTFFKGLDMGR